MFFDKESGFCTCYKQRCEFIDLYDYLKERALHTTEMTCPRCGKTLTYAGDRKYVDISEHVSCLENNPEWVPPGRPTFACRACKDIFKDSFYDDYGHIYRGLDVPKEYWIASNSPASEYLDEEER